MKCATKPLSHATSAILLPAARTLCEAAFSCPAAGLPELLNQELLVRMHPAFKVQSTIKTALHARKPLSIS